MKQYHDALKHIMETGAWKKNRTGVDTIGVFGYQMRFNLNEGFPAVTTKTLAWKSVVGELLWFLEGSTDERRLAEITYQKDRSLLTDKTTIWTANADKQGKELGYINTDSFKELGPVYGHQWRHFGTSVSSMLHGFDQISWLVDEIKNNPDSRRLIMSSWAADQIDLMTLPPCHTMAQFLVVGDELNCQLYQRSADMFLGVPFNIASYALLTHMIASACDLKVGDFVHTFGDAHIYQNHVEAVEQQLAREPRKLPTLIMPKLYDLELWTIRDLSVDDFVLDGYDPMPSIKAEMAV